MKREYGPIELYFTLSFSEHLQRLKTKHDGKNECHVATDRQENISNPGTTQADKVRNFPVGSRIGPAGIFRIKTEQSQTQIDADCYQRYQTALPQSRVEMIKHILVVPLFPFFGFSLRQRNCSSEVWREYLY